MCEVGNIIAGGVIEALRQLNERIYTYYPFGFDWEWKGKYKQLSIRKQITEGEQQAKYSPGGAYRSLIKHRRIILVDL
jgi:hypothetical protein